MLCLMALSSCMSRPPRRPGRPALWPEADLLLLLSLLLLLCACNEIERAVCSMTLSTHVCSGHLVNLEDQDTRPLHYSRPVVVVVVIIIVVVLLQWNRESCVLYGIVSTCVSRPPGKPGRPALCTVSHNIILALSSNGSYTTSLSHFKSRWMHSCTLALSFGRSSLWREEAPSLCN